MDVRVGLQRKLNAEELMLLNCGVGEDSWVPWTARRSKQSILKEVSPEYSLEGLMLKLKLWLPDANNGLIGKDPAAGKDWRWEEKGTTEDEIVGWHTNSMDMNLSKLQNWWWTGKPGVPQSMGSQRVGLNWATDWTELGHCTAASSNYKP